MAFAVIFFSSFSDALLPVFRTESPDMNRTFIARLGYCCAVTVCLHTNAFQVCASVTPLPIYDSVENQYTALCVVAFAVVVFSLDDASQRGETPDSKSRALQQLAQDFGSTCAAIAKGLGKKGGEADTTKAYDKATALLVDYLKGTELDPIGSEAYN